MTDRQKIFVFGSNLAGRHGKGSALEALREWDAEYGNGAGPQGNSYAIPTKDRQFHVLKLKAIKMYVEAFLGYAHRHPELDFYVVSIGCGLAGYTFEQIAPMFQGYPSNVSFAEEEFQNKIGQP